jgi:hypothetical protein
LVQIFLYKTASAPLVLQKKKEAVFEQDFDSISPEVAGGTGAEALPD